MKRRRVLFIKLSQFRVFLRKCVTAVLFVSALAFMILSKADSLVLEKASNLTATVFSPIIQFMQLPAQILYAGYEKVRDISNVYKQNVQLKNENLDMLMLKNQVRTLEIENNLLAELLNYQTPPEAQYISARVVAEEGDGFSHSLIAYIGNNNNIKQGQAVLGQESLIGRIENVMGSYARIILLTDINSKIPVIVERSRVRAILSGDNTLSPKLLFTTRDADIMEGDLVSTSGVAGVLPAGLSIGYIRHIEKDNISVKPLTDIESLEYVKIVNYNVFQGLAETKSEKEK